MMYAISSEPGPANAVLDWLSTSESPTIPDIDDQQIAPIQPRAQLGGRDRGDRRGITQHELRPRRRHRRIDRHVRRPGLHHRQHRHDRLNRPRQQQRHPLPRSHPAAGQQVRQPVRGLIELPVRHRDALTSHRHPIGCASHLCGEHRRNRHRRAHRLLHQRRPITPPLQPGMLSLIKHIHRRQPPPRISGHRHQHPLQPPNQDLDGLRRRTRRCEIPPGRRSRRDHRPRSSVRPG